MDSLLPHITSGCAYKHCSLDFNAVRGECIAYCVGEAALAGVPSLEEDILFKGFEGDPDITDFTGETSRPFKLVDNVGVLLDELFCR